MHTHAWHICSHTCTHSWRTNQKCLLAVGRVVLNLHFPVTDRQPHPCSRCLTVSPCPYCLWKLGWTSTKRGLWSEWAWLLTASTAQTHTGHRCWPPAAHERAESARTAYLNPAHISHFWPRERGLSENRITSEEKKSVLNPWAHLPKLPNFGLFLTLCSRSFSIFRGRQACSQPEILNIAFASSGSLSLPWLTYFLPLALTCQLHMKMRNSFQICYRRERKKLTL